MKALRSINEGSVTVLCAETVDHREVGEKTSILYGAKLKINASRDDIDYKSSRRIDRSVIMSLSSCDWIKKHHNLIMTSVIGASKIFLACALTNKSCHDGYRSFYIGALGSTTVWHWQKLMAVTVNS